MTNTQLLKGVLEGCVLQLIQEKERYGYELVQELKAHGFTEIIGGTVYPLLQKLEKKGALSSTMRPSSDGPDRKYYQITQKGEQQIMAFQAEWHSLIETVATFKKITGE